MENSPKTILLILCMIIALVAMSCSDLKNDLPATSPSTSITHSVGWTDTGSVNFHGTYIATQGYDMRPCRACHGATYTGGTSGVSCVKCHANPAGPENCATCHGSNISPAPPTDLAGNTATTARGVGAHQIHLLGTGVLSALPVACSECHVVPGSVYDAGHITSNLRAPLIFSSNTLAALPTGGQTPAASYDTSSLRCSNTFCHGAWQLRKSGLPSDSVFTGSVIVGSAYAPKWNGGPSEKTCGSCHTLPPVGHKAYAQDCSTCHENVLTADGKTKHINGKIDLAGNVVRSFR
jgi:predicted CxxxxCH...CXXCH cytochrome family protein